MVESRLVELVEPGSVLKVVVVEVDLLQQQAEEVSKEPLMCSPELVAEVVVLDHVIESSLDPDFLPVVAVELTSVVLVHELSHLPVADPEVTDDHLLSPVVGESVDCY